MTAGGLTTPQARALRYYGAPQPRSARRAEVGDLPRRDVTERLESLGLLKATEGVPYPLSFDRQLTDAGRRQLAVEAARRGWSLPWHRPPYVGDGADGARRSAEIDRTEADGLDRRDPRVEQLLASAAAWDAQAAELEPRVEQPVRIAIDADCPGCGKPERSFDPARGVFACSSLGGGPCGYESTERES